MIIFIKGGGTVLITQKQVNLIKDLRKKLVEINEEAINDDNFYKWLNKNYFFQENLEDIIVKIKEVEENF